MAHFRIEKRAIVGGNINKDLEHNQFIRTTRKYKNFELRLKYKVKASDESYNGGIQFRSVPCTIPGRSFEMVGYQADIISWKQGALYDEQRRWDFLGMPTGVPQNYKADQWNDLITVSYTHLAYKTINWESIVLIAAMLPMSLALEKTGGAEFLSLIHI